MVKAVKALVDKLTSSILTGLALAAGEEPAVVRALDLLAKELWTLLSCTSLSLLTNPTRGRGDNLPHVLSPFPHLNRSVAEHQSDQHAKLSHNRGCTSQSGDIVFNLITFNFQWARKHVL